MRIIYKSVVIFSSLIIANFAALATGEQQFKLFAEDVSLVGIGDAGLFSINDSGKFIPNVPFYEKSIVNELPSPGVSVSNFNTFVYQSPPGGLFEGIINSFSVGRSHVIVSNSKGDVFSWGANLKGNLIVPSEVKQIAMVSCSFTQNIALDKDGAVYLWSAYTGGKESLIHLADANLKSITSGADFHVGLREDGSLLVLTDDFESELFEVPLKTVFSKISCGDRHVLAITSEGKVVAWGDNEFGQCDVPKGLSDVVDVAGGTYYSLALKADGTVVIWGGIGVKESGVTNSLNFPSRIRSIYAFGTRIAILTQDGKLFFTKSDKVKYEPDDVILIFPEK